MPGTIAAIYTTPQAGTPLHSVREATLEAGKGLVGDRYYEGDGTFSEKLRNTSDWEVTLIELEEIEHFNKLENLSLPTGDFRRNIVTRGIRLNELVGRRFTVGGALLEGMRLCEPCAHLAGLVRPSVVKIMAHRAGLRARIIASAIIRPGDPVETPDT
jgi:MOSC domain-containing protein YiiM